MASSDKNDNDNKKYFLSKMITKFGDNMSKFLKRKNICEIYKELHFYIVKKEKIYKKVLLRLLEYIPLKYITISYFDDSYILEYAFPFIYDCFKNYYYEEIYQLNKTKIINNMNKRAEIGFIFDDTVNFMFNLNKEVFDFKIDIKIIVNSILDLDKIYLIINEDNAQYEINYELIEYYEEQPKAISLDKIFIESKIIYLFQHHQGKNYDGGILIPIKNNPGKYHLFLHQSSIKKKTKTTLNQLANDFEIIKNNCYQYFGIEIIDGYFSYILYYEDKDMDTVYYCQKNNIGYFFYSFYSSNFVDDLGFPITTCLKEEYMIHKNKNYIKLKNFQRNFSYMMNHLKHKIKENKPILPEIEHEIPENKLENLYLGKKIFYSKFRDEKENIKIKYKNLRNLNLCLKEKICKLYPNKEIIINIESKIIKPQSYDKLIERLKNQNEKLIRDLNQIEDFYEAEENIDDDNYIIKSQNLPKKIHSIFPSYKKYREYSNYFVNGLTYPDFPFIIVYEYDDEFKFLRYREEGNISFINIETGEELNDKDKIEFFNHFSSEKIKHHLWELIENNYSTDI